MKLSYTRAMLNAILSGELDEVHTTADPIFGLHVPDHVDGVPDEVLSARQTWSDTEAFDRQAQQLAEMFRKNFDRYSGRTDDAVLRGGPVR
jgi:phosphoenolpyruvate carboxykinase (ATP)